MGRQGRILKLNTCCGVYMSTSLSGQKFNQLIFCCFDNTKINAKNFKPSISSSQSACFRAVKLSQLSLPVQNCKPAKLKSRIGLAGLLATMLVIVVSQQDPQPCNNKSSIVYGEEASHVGQGREIRKEMCWNLSTKRGKCVWSSGRQRNRRGHQTLLLNLKVVI
jgi:hypothetical protein